MSGSLTLALRTAQSGLLTNQQAMNAVANNISNVNTPGYSRKVINMEQRVIGGVGSGVQISSVDRRVDEGLLKSLRIEISTLNAYDARDPYYQRLQELFGKPEDNTSLSHAMTDFVNTVESLAVSPASTMEQGEVMRKGKNVTEMLQRMSETIQELRLQADADISTATARITELAASIDSLNNKLVANSAINADVTDLRDQRDSALDELSSLIDIRYYYRSDGDAVVFTEGGRTLVDNGVVSVTHNKATAMAATTTHAEADLNGIYAGTSLAANDITTEIRSGKLKGLVDMRDIVFPNLQSQIDEFAAQMRDAVNLVHNAGGAFPGSTSLSGTKTFIDENQTMNLGGTSDVTFALVDGNGDQTAITTLDTIMVAAGFTSSDAWTIKDVAATTQAWFVTQGLTGAKVSLSDGTSGKLNIALNDTQSFLVIRDEANTASGSTAQDAEITLTTGVATETFAGFSNMFGLNDFYVDNLAHNIHDSKVLSSSYTLTDDNVLTFYNATSGITGLAATVNLTAAMTLDQIVTAINDTADVGVTATKVPDGAGFRLRIAENNGVDLEIAASATLKTAIGLDVASARASTSLIVREDLVASPGKISRGSLQWDAGKGTVGEYFMSSADGSAITALASKLAASHQFNEAGGLASLNVSFTSFTASIISNSSSVTNTNTLELEYQLSLQQSLQSKSDNFRGVSLDEEMTQLILFEQAYGAAARIISSIQKMFDALENVV